MADIILGIISISCSVFGIYIIYNNENEQDESKKLSKDEINKFITAISFGFIAGILFIYPYLSNYKINKDNLQNNVAYHDENKKIATEDE